VGSHVTVSRVCCRTLAVERCYGISRERIPLVRNRDRLVKTGRGLDGPATDGGATLRL